MKALSIKQPWLWAITDLDKRIENRTWKPSHWIIGKYIALHASLKNDPGGATAIDSISGHWPPKDLPRGCIVATVRIRGWINKRGFGLGLDKNNPSYLANDKWLIGPCGWVLSDVQKLDTPIPCKGALRLWNVPQEILEQINL